MKNLDVYFIDLQTTGARAGEAFILEMAFAHCSGREDSFLVELPPETILHPRIQMVTGIEESDMQNAISFPAAIKRLKDFIPAGSIVVIHYAQFERPFLEAAFATLETSWPFEIICTNEIAKRLYPNLPSRGIKAMAGYFGHDSGDFKRSAGHVQATVIIWQAIAEELQKRGLATLPELKNWLLSTPKAKKSKYEYPLPKEKRLALPDSPGVYRMLNKDRKVLYVGKATSLHHRVNSYFRGQKGRDSFKLEMLSQVMDLEITVCESPLHAALLETDEIKRLNPYYNIALKEGKRTLAFFDRTFSSTAHARDEIHTIGPFSNSMVFDSLMCLTEWIRTEGPDSLPPATMFYEEMDPVLIREGFHQFCSDHRLDPVCLNNMRPVIAMGLIWYRQLLKSTETESEMETQSDTDADENEDNETDEIVTAENIAAKFKRHFIRAGMAYLRVQNMRRMMNAQIEFRLKNKKKAKLKLINGQIVTPGKQLLSESEVWKLYPIETYDRLTVLLTELNKLKNPVLKYD